MARILYEHHENTTQALTEADLATRELGYTDEAGKQELIFMTNAGAYRHFPSLERLDDAAAATTSGADLIGFFPSGGLVATSVQDVIDEIWTAVASRVTGSGTANTVPLFTSATVLGNSIITYSAGTFTQTYSVAGSTNRYHITNADNTNTSSHSVVSASSGGSSGGDPYFRATVSGITNWSFGPDNSVSGDPFVWCASTTLTTSYLLKIDTSGAVTTPLGFRISTAAGGAGTDLAFQRSEVNRFIIRLGSTAESGSDAGSPLEFLARTDAGGAIDTWMSVVRAAGGAITIVRPTTFRASGVGTSSAIQLVSTIPGIRFSDTDAGSNEKEWNLFVNGTSQTFRTRTDAQGSGQDYIVITRSGTGITAMAFGEATTNPTFSWLGTGTATFGGDVSVTRSSSGGTVSCTVSNTSNTSSSVAAFKATSAGSSSTGAGIEYTISGGNTFINYVDAATGYFRMNAGTYGAGAANFMITTGTQTAFGTVAGTAPTAIFEVVNNTVSIDASIVSGLFLVNKTASTSGLQEYSPALTWRGNGWKTNATAASQPIDFKANVVTVIGAAAPTGYLLFTNQINTGGFSENMRLPTAGGVESPGYFNAARATGTTAGGSTTGFMLGTSPGLIGIYWGSGAPSISATQGSIYLRTDGSSTSTRLYVNTNGSTTWTNFTSAA